MAKITPLKPRTAAASNAGAKKVSFTLRKQTPGALCYQEVDASGKPVRSDVEGALIGTLYLRKHAMDQKVPQKLTVTVEYTL